MAYKIIKRTSTNIPTYLCESTDDLTELGKDSKLPMGTKAIVMHPYSTYMFTNQKVFEVDPTAELAPLDQFERTLGGIWSDIAGLGQGAWITDTYTLDSIPDSFMSDDLGGLYRQKYDGSSYFGLIGIPKIDATTSLFSSYWANISKTEYEDVNDNTSFLEIITCEDLAKSVSIADIGNVKQISTSDFLTEGVPILQSKGYTSDQIVFVFSHILMA